MEEMNLSVSEDELWVFALLTCIFCDNLREEVLDHLGRFDTEPGVPDTSGD